MSKFQPGDIVRVKPGTTIAQFENDASLGEEAARAFMALPSFVIDRLLNEEERRYTTRSDNFEIDGCWLTEAMMELVRRGDGMPDDRDYYYALTGEQDA